MDASPGPRAERAIDLLARPRRDTHTQGSSGAVQASLRDLLSHTCSVQALIALAWRLFRHRRTHRSVSLSTRIRSSQLRQAFDWARRGHRPKTLSNVNARSSPFRSRALRSQYKSYQVQNARLKSADCILYIHDVAPVSSGGSRRSFLATPTHDPTISGRRGHASFVTTAGRTSGSPRPSQMQGSSDVACTYVAGPRDPRFCY